MSCGHNTMPNELGRYAVILVAVYCLSYNMSGKLEPAGPQQLALAIGASAAPCYTCVSDGPCSYTGPGGQCAWVDLIPSCVGGCLAYCDSLQSEFHCDYTPNSSNSCDVQACTQTCPPATHFSNTVTCFIPIIANCPPCAYVADGSC